MQGGLKAVVWTDTLQIMLMLAGVTWVLVLGTIKLGGPGNVLELNNKSGRLEFFKYVVILAFIESYILFQHISMLKINNTIL